MLFLKPDDCESYVKEAFTVTVSCVYQLSDVQKCNFLIADYFGLTSKICLFSSHTQPFYSFDRLNTSVIKVTSTEHVHIGAPDDLIIIMSLYSLLADNWT